MLALHELRTRLHSKIASDVFVRNKDEQIDIQEDPDAWLFDFRRVMLDGTYAHIIAELFCERYQDQYPFQLSALEIAGVPLMSVIMSTLYHKGYEDINGFFIRKSRKKTGLLRMVEGEIKDGVPIIMIDDLMNSGNSLWRQFTVLSELGHKVTDAWAILRFRDLEAYKRFTNLGVAVNTEFQLNDFTAVLGEDVKNFSNEKAAAPTHPFTALWVASGTDPSLSYVVAKSQPVIDERRVYVGADDRYFRAINQTDGTLAWEYQVGQRSRRKAIFSSPALYKDLVIFGAYDGNVYALEKATGKRRWLNFEADWVGSSPAVATDLERVFVGLEFGLIHKRGGIAALDANTGKTVWRDETHPALTHSSPLYIREKQQVVVGSNDGVARLYDARTGTKLWEFTTFGGASYRPEHGGFGEGDIKESFVYSNKHDYIVFGSIDGFLYVLDRSTGYLVHHFKCEFGIWSTPCIYENRVYFTSLDRHVRALDLNELTLVFEKNLDNTRIFASPVIVNDKLYIGTNAGRLHELDATTGTTIATFQATERITNQVVYNRTTKRYFLPTYANQIIALERQEEEKAT